MIRVQAADFDPGTELGRLTGGRTGIGGLCMFVGLVRDMAAGRPLIAMTLEHYPGMTERQLARIEAIARDRWPLTETLIIHRYGRLAPGERIVMVAAASAHRDAAFEACRFLIDWLKTEAPFWKREETAAGALWVEASAADDVQARRWLDGAQGNRGGGTTVVEAVFLDFDGVIVESSDIKTAAFHAMYQEFGDQIVEQAVAHHRANGGISRRKKIRHCHRALLGIALTDDDLDALCRRFSALVEDAVVEAALVPGAAAFLAGNHRQRSLFVVSGTPEEELLRIVARRDLGRFFAGVYGSPREKPPIIQDILTDLRLSPDRTLFIGDARTDHDAAAVCGVPFIGRVGEGATNPFPAQTRIIRDLDGLML